MRRAPNFQEISKLEISEFQHGETFGNYRLLLPSTLTFEDGGVKRKQ